MKKIRLLIIEDNRLLREGIAGLLRKHSDMAAISALDDRGEMSKKMQSFKPNVILLDLGLRSQNSLKLAKLAKVNSPEVKVIVMDLLPAQEDVLEFVRAGVSGFILKDATIDDFLRTIRSVFHGEQVLPPLMTGSLFSQIVAHAVGGTASASSTLMQSVRMTKRERQVIELIVDGMTNKEIAQKLNLSTYTVKSHVHNILEKLTLRTRVQIANYARTSENIQETVNSITLMDE